MAETKYYCYCDNNCKYETLTKEQIYAAIVQAVQSGTIGDCDGGFITTVKSVNGLPLRFFVGTQAEYNELADKSNIFALITDETSTQELVDAVNSALEKTNELETYIHEIVSGITYGDITVDNARTAESADFAALADSAVATDFTNAEFEVCTSETQLTDGTYEFIRWKQTGSGISNLKATVASFGIVQVAQGREGRSPLTMFADVTGYAYQVIVGESLPLSQASTADRGVTIYKYAAGTLNPIDATADEIGNIRYRRIR